MHYLFILTYLDKEISMQHGVRLSDLELMKAASKTTHLMHAEGRRHLW